MFIKNDPYASYKLMREEFEKRGYSIETERIKDSRQATFTSPSGHVWQTLVAHLSYPFTSKRIRNISIDKDKSYVLARSMGVTIPYTQVINENDILPTDEVSSLLDRFNRLIVKPTKASLSRGLTLDINSVSELNEAIAYARTVSPKVMVQEQVDGEEIRFTVIDGQVKAAILRRTPRVIGDGVSTIAQLIDKENVERHKLQFPYITYPLLTADIIDPLFLTSDRVLDQGEIFELNRATMIKNGCSVYDVLDDMSPSYIKPVEALVRELGAKFIVVDMFLKDFTKEKDDTNYWFIEFNTSPVLKLFYGCRDGKMYDIVPVLVDTIDKWINNPILKVD
jgi:D-alanine-D-alanine ligase-like ATP-grasp enzyme